MLLDNGSRSFFNLALIEQTLLLDSGFVRFFFFYLFAMVASDKSQSTSKNALVSSLVALAESKGGNESDAAERFNAAVAGSLADPSTSTSSLTSAAADDPAFLEAARRLLLLRPSSGSEDESSEALLSAVVSWLRSSSCSSPASCFRVAAALGPAVAAAASAAAGSSLGELRGALRAAAAAYAVAVRAGGVHGGGGGSAGAEAEAEAPAAAVPSAALLPPLALSPLRRPHSPAPSPPPPPPVEQVLALGSPYHTPKRSPGKFAPFEQQQQQQQLPAKGEEARGSRPEAEALVDAAAAAAFDSASDASESFDDDELVAAPLALFALWAPRLSEAAQVEAARCTLSAVSRGCPWMREEIGGGGGGGGAGAEEQREEEDAGAGRGSRGRWPAAAASAAARSLAHSRLRGPRARAAAALAAAALHARAARELDAAGLISARAAVAVLQS